MEPTKNYINNLNFRFEPFFSHIFITLASFHVSKLSTKPHKNNGENSLILGCIHEVVAYLLTPNLLYFQALAVGK